MMMHVLLLALGCLLQQTLAVFADEAWSIDYHYALLGEPQQQTTFFHQPFPGSKASLLYTLSKKGVLGAVNPRDGSIVWRHILEHDLSRSTAGFLRASQDEDTVLSGINTQVAAWSAAEGRLAWNVDANGPVKDVEILELTDGKTVGGVKDALVLSAGDQPAVQRLDGASGAVKWQFKIDGSDTPYQVSASTTDVYVILLHETMRGKIKIRVLSLDSVDGHKKDEYTLSSDSELASSDTIVSVGANSASPIIAWTDAEHTVLKVNVIGSKSVSSFDVEADGDKAVEKVEIHAPYHTNSRSHFLVQYATATAHWADVFHVDVKKNTVKRAYSLPKVNGKGAFATSTSDANVYFTRITGAEILTVSSASHGVLGRWPITDWNVAKGRFEPLEPLQAVCELSIKGDTISAIRSAVLVSTGDWVLLREGSPVWQRPEVLAGTVAATFANPPEVEDLAQKLEIEAHSNPVSAYIHRLTRHVVALRQLPLVLPSLPQRFLSGFLGVTSDGGAGKDTFGFHKIIACLTDNGRIVALDAAVPYKILWSRKTVQDMDLGEASIRSVSNGVLGVLPDSGAEERYFNASVGTVLTDLSSPDLAKSLAEARSVEAVRFSWDGTALKAYRSTKPSAQLWHFSPPQGERIISLVPRPVNDPVASIGKVLGDRRVLYKYLNPNLALLATANDSQRTASFHVLDTISGAILYSSTHRDVDLQAPISSTMSENWFTYSFTNEASDLSPKGHALVVGEMFESLVPNDRGPLSTSTNFSTTASSTEPFTLAQTYQIPEAISKMAVTQTRQGITSRQLLAVLVDSSAIVGIPYGALDPRRPVNRDPTKDEQAEGLMRYSPVIEFDPRWYLTHQREVMGISEIVTSPALIESTSLVFAYGLDLFGTRLSPSFRFDILGKDFNKFQMLATVAALAVATFVVAPLVMRKQINTRWTFT